MVQDLPSSLCWWDASSAELVYKSSGLGPASSPNWTSRPMLRRWMSAQMSALNLKPRPLLSPRHQSVMESVLVLSVDSPAPGLACAYALRTMHLACPSNAPARHSTSTRPQRAFAACACARVAARRFAFRRYLARRICIRPSCLRWATSSDCSRPPIQTPKSSFRARAILSGRSRDRLGRPRLWLGHETGSPLLSFVYSPFLCVGRSSKTARPAERGSPSRCGLAPSATCALPGSPAAVAGCDCVRWGDPDGASFWNESNRYVGESVRRRARWSCDEFDGWEKEPPPHERVNDRWQCYRRMTTRLVLVNACF